MGAVENYRASMSDFCKREFNVDIGDACRLEMKHQYRAAWYR